MDEFLTSTSAVIDKLGGDKKLAELFEVTSKAVNNWRAFKRFPAHTYPLITEALQTRNCAAPRDLWSFRRSRRAQ